jgi:dihydrofolate synthase/folylpolyglutamate synthase
MKTSRPSERNTPTKSAPLQSDAVVQRLRGLHPRAIDLSLGRVSRLLAALGNPEQSLPCVVHVAGTNGKGSFVAFLKAICEAAGYIVHSYTSPHLVRFAERISVAGRVPEDHELVSVLEECEAANKGESITFFEITTAAAFLAFAQTKADVTLIETGLGGRFDATNVFDRPALTAITPISMDHQSFLGDSLDAIAFEKAGILKKDTPAIIAPQDAIASRIIEDRAYQVNAPLMCHGRDWQVDNNPDGIHLRDGDETVSLPPPILAGPHQTINAGLAAICARRLPNLPVDADALAQGLRTAKWPGRLQRLENGALMACLEPGWELWLDGGHNAAAATMLAQVASTWNDKPLHLIFGALAARDPAEFLAPLASHADYLHGIAIPGEETTLQADAAVSAAKSVGMAASAAASVSDALIAIGQTTAEPGRILICGSLYLAGAVLAQNETPP